VGTRSVNGAIFIMAVALVAGASACSSSAVSSTTGASSATGASGKTITVGVVNDLTGAAGFCGIDEDKGMTLALKQAEAQGALGGLKVNLVVKDDASSSSQAVVNFHSLVDSGAVAILGACDSEDDEALYPIANSSHVPEIMTTGDAPQFTNTPWVYGAAINSSTYVADPVAALSRLGVKTMVTIYPNDAPSTVSDYKAQESAEEKAGIKIVGTFPVTSTTTDYAPEISEIKALHPDAIGVLIAAGQVVTFMTELRAAGLNQPVLGQEVMQTPFYTQDARSAANGSIFATDYAPVSPTASSVAFTKAWDQAYNTTPYYAGATGYDAMEFLIKGLAKAKSFTPAGVKAGLDSVSGFDGAQGVLTVTDHTLSGPGTSVEIKNGELVYLNS
jgi:branched-chain amino acid transport system substrate-binding protein